MGAIPNLSRWKPPPKNYLNPRRPPSLNLFLQPSFNPPHSFFQASASDPFLPTFDLRPSTSSPTSHLQLLPFFNHHLTYHPLVSRHLRPLLQTSSQLVFSQLLFKRQFPSPANSFRIHPPWPRYALAGNVNSDARSNKSKAARSITLTWTLTKRSITMTCTFTKR